MAVKQLLLLYLTFTPFSMSLTQTERGYPPVVEHIGKPLTVKKEMGKVLINA